MTVPLTVLTSTYDTLGNRETLAANAGGSLDFLNTYVYDVLGRMTSVTQQGQTGGRTVTDKRVDLTYDALGRFDTIIRRAGLSGTSDVVATTDYAYDPQGRLSGLSHSDGSSNSLSEYLYGYDFANRLIWSQQDVDTVSYAYDPTGQLTFADHSSQTDETYGYDRTGNRATAGYETGTGNRPTEDATYTYEYDDEGNQTKRTTKSSGAYEVYVWDYHNHLTRVEFRNSSNTLTKGVNYRYDAFGRMIERTVDGDSSKTLRFVYDDAPGKDGLSDLVLTFDANGNVVNRYLHGPSVDQLFSDESAVDGLLWALADRQGTVTDWLGYDDVANTTSVYDHVEYDSFGNTVSQTNGTHTITLGGYTGRWRDAETGLNYHRDRWTQNGRWLSEDRDGFDAGDVNQRRYVSNSPPNATDPSGFGKRPVVISVIDDGATGAAAISFTLEVNFGGTIQEPVKGPPNYNDIINNLVNELDGDQISHLTITSHGNSQQCTGLLNGSPLSQNSSMSSAEEDFIKKLGSLMAPGSMIQLNSCCSMKSPDKLFPRKVAQLSGHPVKGWDGLYAVVPHGKEWVCYPNGTVKNTADTGRPERDSIFLRIFGKGSKPQKKQNSKGPSKKQEPPNPNAKK